MSSASSQGSIDALAASLRDDTRAYPERSFKTIILKCTSADLASPSTSTALNLASAVLKAGQLVAFPTETVYGLGANALDGTACSRIFAAKHRPTDNPLIVHVSSSAMLARLTPATWQVTPAYEALMESLWPGPLTLLLPAGPNVPTQVTAGHKTVAARMPLHPVALALIAHSDTPLAAPSANASGRPSPTRASHVYADLQGRLPLILDAGAAEMGVESTVVDGITASGEVRILRPGACTVEEIRAALERKGVRDRIRVYGRNEDGSQEVLRDEGMERNPTTPGMKYRHYAPDAKVVLLVATQGKGQEDAHTLDEVLRTQLERGHTKIGLMSLDDSPLTAAWQHSLEGSASTSSNGAPFLSAHTPLRLNASATGQRFSLGSSDTPSEAAARLFQGLRALDGGETSHTAAAEAQREACDVILVEAVQDMGVGMAVMNRLAKAAGETVLVKVEG